MNNDQQNEKINNQNEIDNNEEYKNKKDTCTLDDISEKVEDAVEDVVMSVDEAFYGDTHDYTHDIPAMMEMPDKPRKINKVQTRRNILNRVLGKKGKLIFLGIIAVALIIGAIVSVIG